MFLYFSFPCSFSLYFSTFSFLLYFSFFSFTFLSHFFVILFPLINFLKEGLSREVKLDSFYIDRYEVTNDQFSEFVAATGYVTVAERPLNPKDYPGKHLRLKINKRRKKEKNEKKEKTNKQETEKKNSKRRTEKKTGKETNTTDRNRKAVLALLLQKHH